MKYVLIATVLMVVSISIYANQETPEARFQQAVYLEEVTGDLETAISIYEDIVNTASDKNIAARSAIRAAQCYEQLGDQSNSNKIYAKLESEFSEQDAVRTLLAQKKDKTYFSSEKLLPAPWKHNELLIFHSFTDVQQQFNIIGRSKQLVENHSSPQWKTHFFSINTMENGKLFYEYLTNADTNKLISFNTNAAGHNIVKSWIGDGKIHFENTLTGQKYAHNNIEHWFSHADFWDVMRRLPLEKGFKTKLRLHAPGAVSFFEVAVHVTDDQAHVSVPAGEFSAFEIEIESIAEGISVASEKMYYSNNAERYPLKLVGTSISISLISTDNSALTQTTRYPIKSQGLEFTLPPKWFGFAVPRRSDNSQKHVLISLDDHSAALIGWHDRLDIDWSKHDILEEIEASKKWGKGFYKHYQPRELTLTQDLIAGLPAARYQSEFKDASLMMLEDRVWISKQPHIFGITFYTTDKAASKALEEHDYILKNMRKIK